MTVLNAQNDGMLNLLIVLTRAVLQIGPCSRDDLLEYCSAGPLTTSTPRIAPTLNRWSELGLFLTENDEIRLNPSYPLPATAREVLGQLPTTLRRVVFEPKNNTLFWETAGALCSDLTRGIAWLLAQDIYAIDVASASNLEDLDNLQTGKRIFQNDTRIEPLRTWAHFMGFLWSADGSIVDPTAALLGDLAEIFGDQRELTASEFADSAASLIPVLDGGTYRTQLEDGLDQAYWQPIQNPKLLSTSLSRALWRLENMGRIRLLIRADARDSRTLQRSGQREWRSFTHIALQGADA